MYRLFRYLSILFLLGFMIQMGVERGVCGEASSKSADPRPPEHSVGGEQTGWNPGAWLASFFRDHISAVDGDKCPSMPTCSAYSIQAFEKHGFFIGWIMTVDRLIHEGGEASVSPLVHQNGAVKIFDPVESNDFWWYQGEGHTDD
ncbi:MAG: membrane protein insertion efficiency factor YidD [Desulfatiglandaceae bacterium]